MIQEMAMLGTRVSNIVMMAPVALRAGLKNLTQIRFDDNAVGQLDIEEILSGAEDEMQTGGSFEEVSDKINRLGGGAYHIVYKIGIFLALISIMFVSIRFFFANPNERQELKGRLIWIFVGAILILGACSVLLFVSSFSNGLFTG